jgi:exonuclease III
MANKFNIKDQLAGVAALIAAIVAIGGGFVKYGEITTKLNNLEAASKKVDKVSIEMVTANQKDIEFLKNKKGVDLSSVEESINTNGFDIVDNRNATNENGKGVAINSKEIELLKIQIEEIKISTSNPLTN